METPNGVKIVKQRLRDYIPKVISLGRQFINGGCMPVFRDRSSERTIVYNSDDDDTASVCSSISSSSTISIKSNISTLSKKTKKQYRKNYKQKINV